MIDDPHFQKNKPTSSKSKSHLRGNPPQANPNLRPSPSSPAFPHVLGLYFTEFSRTICVWPRILRPMARDPTKNISHPWVPRKNWQLKNEIGRGYVSFMKGMYYIYIYGWIAFLFVRTGETHPIGYVSLVDSVSSAAPKGLPIT